MEYAGEPQDDLLGSVQSAWLTDLAKAKKGIKAILESNHRKIAELTKDFVPVQKPQNEPPQQATEMPVLADEPEDGILIAVQIPEQRIARRFDPNGSADQVFIWVASQEKVAEKGIKYGEFELVGPQNTLLEPGKTLAEQSVSTRTIFNLRECVKQDSTPS